MGNKRPYRTPEVVNISGFGVVGYEFLGYCAAGDAPTTNVCQNGNSVTQDPTACSPNGILPQYGRCLAGSVVVAGCVSGASH